MLDKILNLVIQVCNVSLEDMISRDRHSNISSARGLYYFIARENNIHPEIIAKKINRNRTTVIIIAGKYAVWTKIYSGLKEKYKCVISQL